MKSISQQDMNSLLDTYFIFFFKAYISLHFLYFKVHPEFLSLFQPSQLGSLLFELLVLVERLCEGRLTPHYQSGHWQYNELSLHEVLFGINSRLADCLLSLIIHPEEEVQIQACRVILKMQLNEEGEIQSTNSSLSKFFCEINADGPNAEPIY